MPCSAYYVSVKEAERHMEELGRSAGNGLFELLMANGDITSAWQRLQSFLIFSRNIFFLVSAKTCLVVLELSLYFN